MKNIFLSILCAFSLCISASSFAEDQTAPNPKEGGTLKGAAAGGLGGAVVGHPVAGAAVAVGGVIGHHRRHKTKKEARKSQEQAQSAG